MSLRLRLLLAVGAISIVALVVADFATYSALRSSLYNQVDQQLAQHRPDVPVDVATGNVVVPVTPERRIRRQGPVGKAGRRLQRRR